ncbi:hypothetical protein GCM10007424_27200 [Flavobacterium suaedae]|uniref:SusE outer membrane protein domain-containing protein n=2 Tax=Flavobacterium suaedae TaxID=1767027 RepID=A0ABQ1K698_9FLAO|nr:hypothetical protein GCM10007424_27200 [Flavobacterium suaedae]
MSCSTDDNQIVIEKSTDPVLMSPDDGGVVTLTPSTADNAAVTFVWDHAAYSENTEINYSVEIALAETDFAEPVELANTTNRFASVTGGNLKTKLMSETGLNVAEDAEQVVIEARVIASLGDNSDLPMTSNSITLTIVFASGGEGPTEPALYMVGAPQAYYELDAWSPANAIPMRYIGDGTTQVFEAYVKVGAADGFKFVNAQADWGDIDGNYGTISGAQDGNLENSPGSGDIKIAETDGDGFYYVWVDIDNLTYEAVKMDWGIIGAATPSGWDAETPMTYNFAENKYSITVTLITEEMKFRSKNTGDAIYNDQWAFQVGADDTVVYNTGAGNIAVTAGETTIDLEIGFDGTATVSGL